MIKKRKSFDGVADKSDYKHSYTHLHMYVTLCTFMKKIAILCESMLISKHHVTFWGHFGNNYADFLPKCTKVSQHNMV